MANKPEMRVIRKRNRRSIVPRIIIGLVMIIAVASAVAIYFDQEEQFARIRSERVRLDAELAKAKARNESLLDLAAVAGTDAYVEWVARNQLGLVRPEEIILTDG